MADNRNRIYRCEYTKNGEKYRMDIIPAYNVDLFEVVDEITQVSAIPVVILSPNAFDKINDLNSKFIKKLPMGMVAADDLKVTADLSYMPNELVDYMQEPFYDMTASIDYTIGTPEARISPLPLSMTTAMVFILKKEIAANTWETLFVGTPKKTPERKVKSTKGTVTIEFDLIDISKTIYALVTSELIANALLKNGMESNIDTLYIDQYIDTQYYDGTDVVYFTHYNHSNGTKHAFGIWFYHKDMHEQIDILAAQIYAKFLRCISTEISITHQNNPFIGLKFYKQNNVDPNTPGEIGDLLTYNDLMFFGAGQTVFYADPDLAFLTENCDTGFLIDAKDNKNNIHEHKTAWDFYKALADTNCCKLNISFTDEKTISVNWLKLLEKNPNNTPIIPDYGITNGEDFELTENYNVLNGIKCSLTDQMEKNEEEYSTSNDGSKADPEEEYKSLFHTIPTGFASDTYKAGVEAIVHYIWDGVTSADRRKTVDSENPFKQFCNGKIYYYDANSWSYKKTTGCAAGNLLKAHANISIDDGIAVTDYMSTPITINTFVWTSAKYPAQYLAFIRFCNSELNKCKFLASLFGWYNQCLWDMECDTTEDLTLKNIGDTVAAPAISQGQINLLIGEEPSPEHPNGVPGRNYALGKMLQLYFTVGAASRIFTILDITTDLDKAVTKAKIFIKGK